SKLKEVYVEGSALAEAFAQAVQGLKAGLSNGAELGKLEVAILDRHRPGRAFRRITGAELDALMPANGDGAKEQDKQAQGEDKGAKQATADEKEPGKAGEADKGRQAGDGEGEKGSTWHQRRSVWRRSAGRSATISWRRRPRARSNRSVDWSRMCSGWRWRSGWTR